MGSLNFEIRAFVVRKLTQKVGVFFISLTALGDRYMQNKIRYHPLSSRASFEGDQKS